MKYCCRSPNNSKYIYTIFQKLENNEQRVQPVQPIFLNFPIFFIKELIRVIHKSFTDAIHSNLHIVSSVTFLAHPIVKCRHQ